MAPAARAMQSFMWEFVSYDRSSLATEVNVHSGDTMLAM